jgi:hypothetical protein
MPLRNIGIKKINYEFKLVGGIAIAQVMAISASQQITRLYGP